MRLLNLETDMLKINHTSKLLITVRIMPDGNPFPLKGQLAQLVSMLVERLDSGLTSLDALFEAGIGRCQARISELRQLGMEIETTRERSASGASIGRYWLRSNIEIDQGGDNGRS